MVKIVLIKTSEEGRMKGMFWLYVFVCLSLSAVVPVEGRAPLYQGVMEVNSTVTRIEEEKQTPKKLQLIDGMKRKIQWRRSPSC